MPSHLVAVLHSLPIGDGARTKSRIEIARDALGCRSHTIANLYPDRLKDVNGLGSEPIADEWMRGRREILQAFEREDITDVLMGYGLQLPTGAQRAPFRSQVEWLHEEVAGRSVRVWTFGGRPAHPSRWQRVSHKYRPGSSIRDVARDLLTPFTFDGLLERQS